VSGATTANYLGLLELSDSEGLFESVGGDRLTAMRDNAAHRLQQWLRDDDECRLEDECRFRVMLKGISDETQVRLAASKLQRLFREPFELMGNQIQIEVVAGFAAAGEDAGDLQLAHRQAARALRQARISCNPFEIYSPQMERQDAERRALQKELAAAVETGRLELYYQPKLHAGYRTVVGAEALVRWHDADGQVRYPADFMPVAERSPVIRPLTWWAIKSAIARLSRWPEELSMSVNITPNLLLHDEVITVVRDALDIFGVAPSRFTLEVTESVMAEQQDTMLRQLASIRQLGVRVSIDDFGTGFSSLAYFRDLPADEIKIDKSFVIPMLESPMDQSIVKAVIDLAHNFSLRVVAEGVENEAVAQRLGDMRCDLLQGFLFDRPLPVDDFERRYVNKSGPAPATQRGMGRNASRLH
jgi:EAL domain-containing protein (putative c-di-GMP-specific phosphodiesterase class I)